MQSNPIGFRQQIAQAKTDEEAHLLVQKANEVCTQASEQTKRSWVKAYEKRVRDLSVVKGKS